LLVQISGDLARVANNGSLMAEFPNARRGLHIEGTDYTYLTEGAYGIVFVDRKTGRIRKVYRAHQSAKKDHSQNVFRAETEAYATASRIPGLRDLIPMYYGVSAGQKVIDKEGKDVTTEFHPDLAFEAEFIDCSFQKLPAASQEEQTRVMGLFRKYGIQHFTDVSVCMKDGSIIKVIDFAMQEIELWVET
jgi:hypothetical protein